MSYKDFVNIKIVLNEDEYQLNETIKGEVFIKNNSPIKLDLEHIQLKLILKHQGKGETDAINLESILINEYPFIARGQTISKEFEFSPAQNISYNGYNLTQNIIIKTKVDITKESEKLLRSSKLSEFKIGGYFSGVFKPDFYHEHTVLITKHDINYNIKSAKGKINPGLNAALITLGIATIIAIFLGVILREQFEFKELLYGITGVLVVVFLIVYYFKLGPALSIGYVTYNLKNLDGNSYEVNLDIEKRNRHIKEITYQLIAEEKVTYDNGSSRSTTKHTFYRGPLGTITRKARPIRAEAILPEKPLPKSISNNDFEIIWYFKISILTKKGQKISGKSKIIIDYEI